MDPVKRQAFIDDFMSMFYEDGIEDPEAKATVLDSLNKLYQKHLVIVETTKTVSPKVKSTSSSTSSPSVEASSKQRGPKPGSTNTYQIWLKAYGGWEEYKTENPGAKYPEFKSSLKTKWTDIKNEATTEDSGMKNVLELRLKNFLAWQAEEGNGDKKYADYHPLFPMPTVEET